jgi:kynureninase
MVSFYTPTPKRFKILCEGKAFPSDYIAFVSQIKFHGFDPKDALLEVLCSPPPTPREGRTRC